MKVLFITDSLSLPRSKPEKVDFCDTYFSLLQKKYPHYTFLQMAIGGATLPFLFNKSSYYESFYPDIVIVQSGVVDCAPRALKEIETKIIGKLRMRVPSSIINKLREYRNLRKTSPLLFRSFVKKMLSRFGKNKVYWIKIMPSSEQWEAKVPGISTSIKIYNSIIEEETQDYILGKHADTTWLMSDFHHLNKQGHLFLAEDIDKLLLERIGKIC